ncbi:MAG: hypothetical protein EPO39_01475 [Candidatus Manganitrophaceae bacterium]|nr:MAG: hypothetical protein EPO39_01475 [Candidatus Manganitrophaceae bacterium]
MNYVPWINFILGLWLIISPFLLGYSHVRPAMWNEIIVGVLVLIFSSTVGASLTGRTTSYRTHEQSGRV